MQETPVMEIIRVCRALDETASDIYAKLQHLCDDQRLSDFWQEMSKAEDEHVVFWKRAEDLVASCGMPSLFEHPGEVIADLNKASSRAQELLRNCEETFSVSKAFTLAYRMEFYLLHPAFAMLFHLIGPNSGGTDPEDAYESHIDRFVAMLAKHGNVTPELELLGETLQRLWKENKHLARQSTRDYLTGVLNRRGFFAIALQIAYLAQRTRATVGVMMIDLDHFKAINDRLGHTAGDVVLKATAKRLTEALRTSDIIARYGGEEFVIMLPEIEKGATAKLAEKLQRAIAGNPPEGIPLTVSIGVAEGALGRQVQEDFHRLIQKADAALYQAKKSGRNKIMEYRPDDEDPNRSTTGLTHTANSRAAADPVDEG